MLSGRVFTLLSILATVIAPLVGNILISDSDASEDPTLSLQQQSDVTGDRFEAD